MILVDVCFGLVTRDGLGGARHDSVRSPRPCGLGAARDAESNGRKFAATGANPLLHSQRKATVLLTMLPIPIGKCVEP